MKFSLLNENLPDYVNVQINSDTGEIYGSISSDINQILKIQGNIDNYYYSIDVNINVNGVYCNEDGIWPKSVFTETALIQCDNKIYDYKYRYCSIAYTNGVPHGSWNNVDERLCTIIINPEKSYKISTTVTIENKKSTDFTYIDSYVLRKSLIKIFKESSISMDDNNIYIQLDTTNKRQLSNQMVINVYFDIKNYNYDKVNSIIKSLSYESSSLVYFMKEEKKESNIENEKITLSSPKAYVDTINNNNNTNKANSIVPITVGVIGIVVVLSIVIATSLFVKSKRVVNKPVATSNNSNKKELGNASVSKKVCNPVVSGKKVRLDEITGAEKDLTNERKSNLNPLEFIPQENKNKDDCDEDNQSIICLPTSIQCDQLEKEDLEGDIEAGVDILVDIQLPSSEQRFSNIETI